MREAAHKHSLSSFATGPTQEPTVARNIVMVAGLLPNYNPSNGASKDEKVLILR